MFLIGLAIKFSKEKNIVNDEQMLNIVQNALDEDGYDHFELESIISMNKPNVTSVIVSVGYMEIALEIDNDSGKIINKEKIAKQ